MNSTDIMYAVSRNDGLDIIVRRGDGTKIYIGRHRWNGQLYTFLKNGRTVREIKEARILRGKGYDKLRDSLRYIVSVAEYALDDAA